MNFLYINEKNIKVSISCDELEKRGVNVSELDCESVRCKQLLCELLDEAHREIGFEVGHSKLSVSAFTSVDGDCELFVTKHNNLISRENEKADMKSPESCIIVVTDNDNDMYSLCARLKKFTCGNQGHKLFSSLYCEMHKDNRLVLLIGSCDLSERNDSASNPDKSRFLNTVSATAAEYGNAHTVCSADDICAYLSEHCHCIASANAIEKLLCD